MELFIDFDFSFSFSLSVVHVNSEMCHFLVLLISDTQTDRQTFKKQCISNMLFSSDLTIQ